MTLEERKKNAQLAWENARAIYSKIILEEKYNREQLSVVNGADMLLIGIESVIKHAQVALPAEFYDAVSQVCKTLEKQDFAALKKGGDFAKQLDTLLKSIPWQHVGIGFTQEDKEQLIPAFLLAGTMIIAGLALLSGAVTLLAFFPVIPKAFGAALSLLIIFGDIAAFYSGGFMLAVGGCKFTGFLKSHHDALRSAEKDLAPLRNLGNKQGVKYAFFTPITVLEQPEQPLESESKTLCAA